MINTKMQDALNAQLNREFYSAYLYLSMAAYFESVNLKGFANWMEVQRQEELVHSLRFYHYIIDRGGKALLGAIDGPPTQWTSPLRVFQAAYAHEQKVTAHINDLVSLAIKENDHATHNFLQWFVSEQVEEEASADGVVKKLTLMADAPGGLFMLDQELAQRVFTPPPAAGGAGPQA
ncbi:MAG: ferritin [Candidatus Aureabacteria bacterium]|nr:ferritin [Candidatus Auribacterota bacterium]